MNKEELLTEELESCFADWDGDFDVDVETEYIDGDSEYFSVLITHNHLGPGCGYNFTARVTVDKCEMDFCDDSWNMISPFNVFSFMWFDEAKAR